MEKIDLNVGRSFKLQVYLMAMMLFGLWLCGSVASASTLTWDSNKGAAASDGAGTWVTGTATASYWYNGSAATTWDNVSDASIGSGGTAGSISVKSAITVGNITFNATSSGGYILSGANTITFTGGTVTVDNTTAATTFIKIPLAGSVGFTKAGSGTLILTKTVGNYTGATHVSAGMLQLQGGDDGVATSQTLQVDSGATFDINGRNQTVDALTGAGTVNNSAADNRIFTIGNADGSGEFDGVIESTGAAADLKLVKAGSGTEILGGASTYTGTTTVNAGTLLANGSIAGVVTNASGAYFGGYGGTVGGVVIYQSGSFALFTNNAPMTFNGGLTLTGNPVVHLDLPASLPDGSYTLANYSGTLTGTFATTPVVDSGSYADGSAIPAITTGGGTVTLNLASCQDASITTDLPASTTAFIGGTASFTVGATGTSLTYDWQKNTGSGFADVIDGTGQGTPTYYTPTLTGAETGWQYQCIVSASCGSPQTSSASTLTVTDPSVYSFQTVQSGNWNDPNTWNQSTNGVNWGPTTATPSYLNSNITVQAGHKVTVTAPVTIDDTVIQAGGEVDVSGVTLNLTGTGATVAGTLQIANVASSVLSGGTTSTLTFESGGVFDYKLAGAPAVPTATWADGSTCLLEPASYSAAVTATGISGQSFYDLTINNPSSAYRLQMGVTGTTTVVRDTLSVTVPSLASDSIALFHAASSTLTVSNMTITTGTAANSDKFLLTDAVLTGELLIISGNLSASGYFDGYGSSSTLIEFDGSSAQTLVLPTGSHLINPTVISYQVDTDSSLTLGSTITSCGTVTANGTFNFGTSQITGGNLVVAVTGTLVGNGTSQLTTGLGSIAYDGTLNLPGLPTFAGGESFVLFGATSYSGSFASIIPATPGAGLTWDTSQLTTSGTLAVTSGGSSPVVVQITGITFDGANININGSAGATNALASFSVVTNGDFSTPVASWSVQGTGACDENGDFTYSVPMDTGTSVLFYDVHVP